MSTIFKYMLPVSSYGPRVEAIPQGGEVIHVQDHYMWILLPDTSLPTVERTFQVYGTGWQFDSTKHHHLGTWKEIGEHGITFIWHAFERF